MPRRYGQHFLRDENILRKIVEASGVGPDDTVLEIGPGEGYLTRILAEKTKNVIAVEIDRHLAENLKKAGLPANVEIRQGNALELVLGKPFHLVSNLPYEITTAVLQKFLLGSPKPASITLLIQKEVAERIMAKGGMNRLALLCGYHALPKILFTVPKGAFSPPPKVESAVIRLEIRQKPLLDPVSEERLFKLSEAAFAQKRKTLANSLGSVLGADASEKIKKAGFDPKSRPEQIKLEQWILLASRV